MPLPPQPRTLQLLAVLVALTALAVPAPLLAQHEDGAAAVLPEPDAPPGGQGKGALEVEDVVRGSLPMPDVVALRAREAVVQERGDHTRQGLSFACSDVTCAATLFRPKAACSAAEAGGNARPPVIVMAHGLGGERTWLERFAVAFAKAGFAALTFDYRTFGSSDGAPRQWVSVPRQHADWLAAVEFAQTLPDVDAGRLSLWGTSFAGGHVIVVASKLPGQVRAVVSQVPHLDGVAAGQANAAARGARGNAKVMMAALADLAADINKAAPPVYIPLAGRIGSTAVMQLSEHDLDQYSAAHTETEAGWANLTRASFVRESRYSPINFVRKVQAPLLVIAAKQDTLAPYASAVAAVAKAPNATLITLDAGHFDGYNEPLLHGNLRHQVAFLRANAC